MQELRSLEGCKEEVEAAMRCWALPNILGNKEVEKAVQDYK